MSAVRRLLQVLGYIVLVFVLTFLINSLIKVTILLTFIGNECSANIKYLDVEKSASMMIG